ncbi:hypothetical protein NPIL_679751 [Nephila pilipes]|uniref:Uncharacterized protein n=1 Tax=Nephila pilipes TaxID=299642 RepID=A0A8X6MSN6_NEPPI|nr:hypothetical protein NPIL_679751 [Nephila pilipes]
MSHLRRGNNVHRRIGPLGGPSPRKRKIKPIIIQFKKHSCLTMHTTKKKSVLIRVPLKVWTAVSLPKAVLDPPASGIIAKFHLRLDLSQGISTM